MIVPDAVGVVAIATLAVFLSEVLLYLWAYRTAGFKSAKVSPYIYSSKLHKLSYIWQYES